MSCTSGWATVTFRQSQGYLQCSQWHNTTVGGVASANEAAALKRSLTSVWMSVRLMFKITAISLQCKLSYFKWVMLLSVNTYCVISHWEVFINCYLTFLSVVHYYRWRRKRKWWHRNWSQCQQNSLVFRLGNNFWQISATSSLSMCLLLLANSVCYNIWKCICVKSGSGWIS